MSPESARSSHRRVISYIDRSREFYAAHGYETPYEWSVHDEVPFAPLAKPTSEIRLGVVTTAFPHGEHTPKRAFARPIEPKPTSLFTADLSWHKEATHTDDVETFLPIEALQRAVAARSLGELAPRFYGVPTEYSQRRTRADAELIGGWCQEDEVDAVLLIPLCPVCHQTVSLVARYLESEGIPTVIIGSARDIVEECGVARFVFTDLPLGNPCGPPNDSAAHDHTISLALRLLDSGVGPRATIQSPLQWPDHGWRDSYMRVDDETRPRLAAAGEARRAAQASRRRSTTS